jgi:hypothetical protein
MARDWLKSLSSKTIPRHICEVSFSRSSGPGGQNVNKSVTPLEDQYVTRMLIGKQGQFQSDVKGSLGVIVAFGSALDTSAVTRFPLCGRQIPVPGDSSRRGAEASEQCGVVL